MRIPKKPGEKKENAIDLEEMIQEKIAEFRNLDIRGILSKQDRFDEITKGLDEDQKAVFDKEFEGLVDQNEGLINALADCLEDPETREKIIEQLRVRVRGRPL